MISALQQLLDRQITTRQFVQLVEEQHWKLLEGRYHSDRSANASHAREVLSDIVTQWESRSPGDLEEFSVDWVQDWLRQLRDLTVTTSQSSVEA